MARAKRLIIGLGNPGAEYADTRHSIGFSIIDALSARTRTALKVDRSSVLLGWGQVRGNPFGLAKPLTHMNRSGEAVRKLIRRLSLSLQDVLIVSDDIHLDLGVVRLRRQGSAGGHNGIQDIIDSLGSEAFPRLRLGVGHDFSQSHQVDYVLSPFTEEEKPLVADAVTVARDAALLFVCEGIVAAMNRYNRR